MKRYKYLGVILNVDVEREREREREREQWIQEGE